MKFLVLQPSRKPLPPDVYVPSKNGDYAESKRSSLKDSSRNSTTKPAQRTVRIQDEFNPAQFRDETQIERKIRAATLAKPANIWVKILHDFESSDSEELRVQKGQFVKVVFQQNDWLYVMDSLGNEGFVPFSYCSTFNVTTKKSSTYCDDINKDGDDLNRSFERLTIEKVNLKKIKQSSSKMPSRTRNKQKSLPVTYFPKRVYVPQMTVLYDYNASYEHDVRVRRVDFVMLLNDPDPDWSLVMT